ncbi:MAG: pyridoxal phosphate-dependent aminotransferase [Lachnospiraceae bacterium]|nr:pyridoxal phosphate-dependent aminotransferase [Lachnospiraceae bacterium]
MIAEGIDVLKLNIGNPAAFQMWAPPHTHDAIREHLQEAEGYSDSRGLLVARQAVADYCVKRKRIEGVTADDVFMGNGVSELIQMTLTALLNKGDEVLIPSPDYPLWTACVILEQGTPVYYACDEESDWNPDIADIRRKITDKTRAIVLINPNNPTGAIYDDEALKEIAQIAREHDLIILSDETYDRVILDGLPHTSIAALAPDVVTLTFNGLSKSHRLCGYRVGWVVVCGPKEGTEEFREGLYLLASMRLCANVNGQYVVPDALADEGPDPVMMPGGRAWEQRNAIWESINEIPGVSAVKPKATFYIFPKIDLKKYPIHDDEQFALDFLHQKHILVVNGTGFNWPEHDHFRIVFLAEAEKLRYAARELGDFLEGYHQD